MSGLMDFEDEENDDLGQVPEPDDDSQDDDYDDDDAETDLLREAMQEEEEVVEELTPEPTPEPENEAFKNEENARNAERRRQNEERIMNKLRSESPEFLLAQQLTQQFNKSPEVLLSELMESQMKNEAQRQGVPYEVLQRQNASDQRANELQQRLDNYDFMMWNNQIEADKTTLKTEFPMLDDKDLDEAKGYITGVLQNLNVPLKSAVLAVHGEKIIQGLRSAERNEALAEVSGRKAKSTPPPKSGKSDSGSSVLSAEEAFAAKALGISEKDYLKYRI